MQAIDHFFTFSPYCGDATQYMIMGEECAKTGDCYNALRPAATIYWFSVPFRLGLSPAATLISAHMFLASISICLSVIAMFRFFRIKQSTPATRVIAGLLFVITSTAIHGVFLMPVFRVPLSDVPANTFVLIAIWLFLINPCGHLARLLAYGVIGLLLGLSTGIRVFFLYPVIFVLSLWLVLWLANKKRQMVELAILLAFIPMAGQFYITWKHTASISYIDPQLNNQMLTHHLDHNAIGLESIMMPQGETGFRWYPDCSYTDTLLNAIKNIDVHSIQCVISGRLNFYLGSYNDKTYIAVGDEESNQQELLLGSVTQGGEDNAKTADAIVTFREKQIPVHRLEALNPALPTEIYKTLPLQADGDWHQIGTVIATDNDHSDGAIDIIIRNHETKSVVSAISPRLKPITQVEELSPIFFRFRIPTSGLYDVIIKIPPAAAGTVRKQAAILYSWDFVVLEQANVLIENTPKSNIRFWSSLLYWINVAIYTFALVTVLRKVYEKYNQDHLLAYACVLLTCGQALLTLPEQRFFITPMITIWVIGVCPVIIWLSCKFPSQQN